MILPCPTHCIHIPKQLASSCDYIGEDSVVLAYNRFINLIDILLSLSLIWGFIIHMYCMIRKIGFQWCSSLSVPIPAVRGRACATRMRRRVVRIRSRPRRPECRRHRKRSNTQLSIASFTPSVFLHVATTANQASREKMTRDCKNEACKVNTEQHTTKLIKANDAMIMISLTPLRH